MGVFDTSKTTTTSLPGWFTESQKDIATKAGAAYNAVPTFEQTAGGAAAANLGGAQNPFMSAINTLQGVATGAANPWLPSGEPNTQTALGGLFAAQNAQLNKILPSITAKEGAAGIGGGGFGSLRGQTATETARGGALTSLAAEQAKAALDAQTQAIQAGTAIGNIGSQYGTTAGNLADKQMTGALAPLTKYQDILGSMAKTLPTIAQSTESISQADQLSRILGTIGANSIDKVLAGNTGLGWLDSIIKGIGSGISNIGSTSTPAGSGSDYSAWLNSPAGQQYINQNMTTDFGDWLNSSAGTDWLSGNQ